MHQHVGNWPGKTVEKAEGRFRYKHNRIEIIDLPGNYGLSAYSMEEIVSRDYIVDEDSDVIINIIDAGNIERNLYLTVQLMELGANLIVALNMNKSASKKGIKINAEKLSELLGVPVFKIEASNAEGVDDLLDAVLEAKENPINPSYKLKYGNELSEHIHELESLIKEKNVLTQLPPVWVALKLLEDDKVILEEIKQTPDAEEILNKIEYLKKHLKDVFGSEIDEAVANSRYGFINGLVKESITRPAIETLSLSDRIDNIVTHKYLGIPIFLLIMWLTFQITFTIGTPFQELIEWIFGLLGNFLLTVLGHTWFSSLLVEGIIGGVGGILVFFPLIFLLFLVLSFLEDSGYLARAAFVMDKVMHTLVGLHGKAFIPMILGFGCCVPGVMATRTLENDRDRLTTMLIIPFMSCSARLPVYILFAGAFFSAYQGLVIFSMYVIGVIIAILVALIFKRTLFKGMSAPFVMELPAYKLPTLKSIFIHAWERAKSYIKKAGTIILVASIVIWLMSSLPMGVDYASQSSITGQVGTVISPVFEPLGFGGWQPAVALIFGVVAKELVVSSFTSMYSVADGGLNVVNGLHHIFTPLSAFSFMIFVLLYIPCFATFAAIRNETNTWKWPIFMCFVTTVVAFVVSFIVYQGGLLLGFG